MKKHLFQTKIEQTLIPKKLPITEQQTKRLPKSEHCTFQTTDGLTLHGNWFQGTNGKTVIFSHSFGANRFGWFEEGKKDRIDWIPSIQLFIKRGWNVFIFDHRACGESEGTLTFFGVKESLDVEAAFQWCLTNHSTNKQPLIDFVFIGFSSGANAALYALQKLEKRTDKRFVIILSNIYWYAKMFPNSITYFTNLPKQLVPILTKTTAELVGFNPYTRLNPCKEIATIHSPILMVNSTTDIIAQIQDIQTLFQVATNQKELFLIDGERFDSYHIIEKETQKVFQFIEQGLQGNSPPTKKIALLTIEYQNSWTQQGIFHQLIKKEYLNRKVYAHTIDLLEKARDKNLPIFHAPLILDSSDHFRYQKNPIPAKFFRQLTKNSPKSELTKNIYQKGDVLIHGRSSYDACIDSNLLESLQKQAIDTVILLGFTTDH